MKILLLGSNGQLGSDLLNLSSTKKELFEIIPLTRKQVDLSNLDESYQFLNNQIFEVLVNCTAYNRVDDAEFNHSSEAFLINSHAVKVIAEVCENKKAKLIHLSTDYVFDGRKSEPYKEADPTSPLNIYGSSKVLGETFAQTICSNSLILRTASLFGIAGSSGKGGNFVEVMIRGAKEKRELKVVEDIMMSPTSTLDIAKIILKLIHQEAKPGIYHSVNSGKASWYEFAKEIFDQTKMKANLIPTTHSTYSKKVIRPEYSVLDNSKLSTITGEIPHWKDSLNHYLKEKGYL